MNDRRTFIQTATAATAGVSLFNIARAGASPNEKVRHAGFGASGMAFGDIKSLTRDGLVDLVAVAEVDDNRVKRLKAEFPEVKIYRDWRVLLEKEHKNLDSVNVSTPDHMHAPIGVTAMNLGLHVYGQKPLAQSLHETRRMAEIAKERGVVTQMGIQLSSSTYERLAVRMVQEGVIGKVREVHMFSHKTWGDPLPRPEQTDPVPPNLDWDLWLGVAAERPYIGKYAPPGEDSKSARFYYHPGQWRKRLDFGTGTLGDMGCHIFSPMFRALDLRAPLSVTSTGGRPNAHNWAVDEQFEYVFPGSRYTVEGTLKVTWCDGALRPPKEFRDMFGEKMPKQGCVFVGADGVLLAPHNGLPVPYPQEKYGDYRYPKFPARDHYRDFIAAVRGGDVKPIADFHAYGGPLTETVLLGGVASHFPDETLEWDAAGLRFSNNKKANAFVRREYRKGWDVEGLS
jgi:predicted dehydrogenase